MVRLISVFVKTSLSFNHSGAPEPQSRPPPPPPPQQQQTVVVGDMSDARDNVINVNNKGE